MRHAHDLYLFHRNNQFPNVSKTLIYRMPYVHVNNFALFAKNKLLTGKFLNKIFGWVIASMLNNVCEYRKYNLPAYTENIRYFTANIV